jgi:hypothetical protein
MMWEIIAILSLAAVLYLGRKNIVFYLWAFIIGIFVGSWWELWAESKFTYTGFSLYIWKDVPLAIILLWGVAIAGFVLISDFLQKKIPVSKKGNHAELKNCLFWDVTVALVIGMAMEILGSGFFNMWTYPPNIMPGILNIPLQWLFGWGWIGIFVSAFIRRYFLFTRLTVKPHTVKET